MNFVSIDFETANRYRNSPCAVGIVVGNERGIVDEFYSLINPLMEFESQNIYVHGITEADVIDAPTFDELWPTINNYIANNIVVAHNASFDMSVIRATLDHYNLSYPELEYLCSVMISKQVWPGMDSYKLNRLADAHNLTFDHHHALEDARVVVRLLHKALADHKIEDIRELIEGIQITSGKIYERSYVTPKVKRTKKKNKVIRP